MKLNLLVDKLETSLIERQFWLLNQHEMGGAYNINSVFRAKNIDFDKLINSVNSVISKFDILSSSFQSSEGEIYRTLKHSQCKVIEKLFDRDKIISDEHAKNWVIERGYDQFNLENEPMVKIIAAKFKDDPTIIFAISVYHIIIDLRSKDIFFGLISDAYNNSATCNISPESETQSNNYQQFVLDQRNWLSSDAGYCKKV